MKQRNPKFTFIFSLLILLASNTSFADSMWYPGIVKIYDSDLVVDANYVRQNEDFFWIKINDVLRGEKYALRRGDVLRIVNTTSGSCGFSFSITDYTQGRFYLKKAGKTQFKLINNSSTGIDYISNDSTNFYFSHSTFKLKTSEFNRYIKEFQTCYDKYPESMMFSTIVSDSVIALKAKQNPLIAYFESSYRQVQDIEHFQRRILSKDDNGVEYNRANQLDAPPLFNNGKSTTEMFSYISAKIKIPIVDEGIQHVVFIRILVLANGTIGKIKVAYSGYPELNDEALEIIKNMPKWKAAHENGVTKDCLLTIPIYFNK